MQGPHALSLAPRGPPGPTGCGPKAHGRGKVKVSVLQRQLSEQQGQDPTLDPAASPALHRAQPGFGPMLTHDLSLPTVARDKDRQGQSCLWARASAQTGAHTWPEEGTCLSSRT